MALELAALSETPLRRPLAGRWQPAGFPDVVEVAQRPFRRAGAWQRPYPGVVAQYRETVPRHAMHLKVFADGTWTVDHLDDDNPDMGRAVAHFFHDHPAGKTLSVLGSLLGFGALAYVAASMTKNHQASAATQPKEKTWRR